MKDHGFLKVSGMSLSGSDAWGRRPRRIEEFPKRRKAYSGQSSHVQGTPPRPPSLETMKYKLPGYDGKRMSLTFSLARLSSGKAHALRESILFAADPRYRQKSHLKL